MPLCPALSGLVYEFARRLSTGAPVTSGTPLDVLSHVALGRIPFWRLCIESLGLCWLLTLPSITSRLCVPFQTVAHHRCLGSLSADEQGIGASETCTTPSQKWYLVISAVWHLIDAAYHFYSFEVKEEIGWGLLTIIWPGLRKLSDWNWKSPVARSSVNIIPLENLKNKRSKKYRCWEHL